MGFHTVYRANRVPLSEMADVARKAEALGYDTIGIQEATHDSFLGSVKAIDGSTDIRIDTRLTICFPRSPMVTAMSALSGKYRRENDGLDDIIHCLDLGRYSEGITVCKNPIY